MSIIKYFISYVLTAIFFFVIDMIWLGVVAKNMYRNYLGNFLSDQVNWTAAIIFYLLYIIGIQILAVYPAIAKNSALTALLLGAVFGFMAYATYDLTNLATLKNWPLTITIIDIIWGTCLTA
ncbi:MAG: DUF2177 family protein, partial [Candidatus Cloacimonetes bacterium]|nr:DUF2177 family protein [Candidatus Cloacimonadota bacterium]